MRQTTRRQTQRRSMPLLAVLPLAINLSTIAPVFAEGAKSAVLEEITVTARKVAENLQRVPQSVSAMNADALERSFASSLQDLEGMAPNVIIDSFNAFPNSASISIRGISHTEIEKSFDPAIGIVVDGVFLATNAQALVDNFDLERVEVLRGPQGTLFGKNTIGGTINVIRKKPQADFGGAVSYEFSSFEKHNVKAAVDLPVQENFLLRLATSYVKSEGYLDNTANGDELGGEDRLTLRLAALFNITEDLEAYINIDHVHDRPDLAGLRNATQPTQLLAVPGLLGLSPSFPGYPADNGSFDKVRSDLPEDGTEYDTSAISVELNLDKGDYVLTSISAYRAVDEDVYNDFDSEDTAFFNSRRIQDHDQFTQELRFTSAWSDSYDFVAGLYYFWSDYELHQAVGLLEDWVPCGALPGAFASFGCLNEGGAEQTTTSYAAFIQGNIKLSQNLRMTLGGRYTYEKKDFEATPIAYPVGILGTGEDEESWSEFTPRIGLDYQITEDLFLYASFASGFKSGGYNGRAGTVTSIGPYDPEEIKSYEIGLKSSLLDNRVRPNFAAFYNDYEDMQVDLLRAVAGGTGQETIVANAAGASTYGAELELVAKITPNLLVNATLGVLEAEYDHFIADIGLGGITDNSNLELRKAPDWQYSLAVSYERPWADLGTLVLDLKFRESDDLQTTTQNFAFGHRRSVENLDASISFESIDGNWTFSLFGRNITDEEYIQDGLSAGALLAFTSVSIPRVWGAKIDWSF